MKGRDLFLVIGVVASVCGAATPSARTVRIPGGAWRPLYGKASTVAPFSIDRDPVTRGEYLRWRGGVRNIEGSRVAMTGVSRDEARAYCASQGKRLPTLAEWEYVAAASGSSRNGSADPAFIQSLVSTYATRAPGRIVDAARVNAYGVRGMHDLVWEWVGGLHPHHAGAAHDMSCAGAALDATDPRDYPAFLRAAFRAGLTDSTRLPTLGFRCAS